MTTTTKLTAGELNVLAYCASYGSVASGDFAPEPRRYGGRWTKAGLARLASYERRLAMLIERGLVDDELWGCASINEAGREALRAAGYAPNAVGYWLHPSKSVPGWAR